MNHNETNTEFVNRIMTVGCPTGSLIQIMVIEALAQYAENYSVNPIPNSGLVDAEAWMETAQWLKSEMERKYGNRNDH